MRSVLILLAVASAGTASAMQPGRWNVRSAVVELNVPGVPGFLQRMARGRSSVEHKVLETGQGVEALLAPDPKARCTVESQAFSDGRYAQSLRCPQKKGAPVHIARAGTYDDTGFAGRATITGSTAKGPLNIVLDQKATRIGS